MVSHSQLDRFCLLTNREIRRYYGRADCCVFAVGVVCDVLSHFSIQAVPLRVELGIFPDERKLHGCVLGRIESSKKASRDMWAGHLTTLIGNRYLLDSTTDQANKGNRHLGARPLVIDLRETEWFKPDPPWIGEPWTGLLSLWPGVQVRITRFSRQNGWKNAGHYQPRRRKEVVEQLIKAAAPIFDQKE